MNRLVVNLMLPWLVVLVAAASLSGCAVQSTSPVQPQLSKPQVKKQETKKQEVPAATVKTRAIRKVRPVKQAEERPVPVEKPVVIEGLQDKPEPTSSEDESEGAPAGEMVLGRTMFHYDYYPDKEVYFDTIRHLYFYRDAGKWTMSVALPSVYQKNLGTSVRLKINNSRPYELHREHRDAYPPGSGGRGF